MKRKIWRNRAILTIVLAMIALGSFALQYYGIYDIKAVVGDQETLFDRLEESGFADVLHFDHVQSAWASNRIIHIAAILYPPWPDLSDAYVIIEDDAYVVARGGYEWNPEEPEPLDVKWSRWTVDKFKHYEGGALFPPGKFDLAQEAIKVLVDWQNEERAEQRDRAMREWLYTVIREACLYTDWDWIEIDVFYIGKEPGPVLIATKAGKPEWAAGYEKTFTHTIFLWRRSPEDSDWTIDKAVEKGELSQETVDWMLETQQLFVQEAFTWSGAVPYQYSFNDEWQGREILK